MKKERQFHSSYLSVHGVELGKKPIYVFGYSKSDDFVCRLEINAAGIAVYAGAKGTKKLCNHTWEGFVDKLSDGAD